MILSFVVLRTDRFKVVDVVLHDDALTVFRKVSLSSVSELLPPVHTESVDQDIASLFNVNAV